MKQHQKFSKREKILAGISVVLFLAVIGTNTGAGEGAAGAKTTTSQLPVSSLATLPVASEPQAAPEPQELAAAVLLGAFTEDAVAAREAYQGEVLVLHGTVGVVGVDALQQPFLTLVDTQSTDQPRVVQCYFDSAPPALSRLRTGDEVSIQGTLADTTLHLLVHGSSLVAVDTQAQERPEQALEVVLPHATALPEDAPPDVQTAPPASSHIQPEGSTPPPAEPQAQMVWIPRTGSKYHATSTCSNMQNPSHVTLDTAIASGYERCSKCW